jgi:hypothetical protein
MCISFGLTVVPLVVMIFSSLDLQTEGFALILLSTYRTLLSMGLRDFPELL